MATAAQLLDGESLRVVLHPDPRAQTTFPDMIETFDLPHVVVDGETFIGKTRDRHALPHDYQASRTYDLGFAASYAYANYLKIAINCSVSARYLRAYDSRAYTDIAFRTIRNYTPIWEYGRDASVAAVERAVEGGRRLRIALLDPENFWNLHPVDMPSFYIGRNFFELFTEQDAIPLIFRYPKSLLDYQKAMADRSDSLRAGGGPSSQTALAPTLFMESVEFYSTYYTIRSDGEYLRGAYVGVDEKPLRYAGLKVFAERWE